MQTALIKRTWFLVLPMMVAVGCSSDATKSTGASTTASATTVLDESTVVTEVPTTPAPTVAPTTTIPGEGPQVAAATSPGPWIEGAMDTDPVVATEPGACDPLYDAIAAAPYSIQRCGVWNAVGGQRMWTVTKGSDGHFFAFVWQQTTPNNWKPVMRVIEAIPGVWDDFTIVTGNIDSGPNDELVTGIHVAGSGGYLSIAIVDIRSGDPHTLAVYNEIAQGIAVLLQGDGVELWEAQYAAADPDCCPSTFLRHHLTTTNGDWFVSAGPAVPTGDPAIPASAL